MDSTKEGLCITWVRILHLARIPMWLRNQIYYIIRQEYSFNSQANFHSLLVFGQRTAL